MYIKIELQKCSRLFSCVSSSDLQEADPIHGRRLRRSQAANDRIPTPADPSGNPLIPAPDGVMMLDGTLEPVTIPAAGGDDGPPQFIKTVSWHQDTYR